MRPHPAELTRGRLPHVVIVGAGFAGLAAAKSLETLPVQITIIDRRNHHLFQPLLYQVATAALSPAQIAAPIRAILRHQKRTTVLLDEVVGVDLERNAVAARDGASSTFDYLILAPGSRYHHFGHPEWADASLALKTLDDATAIRRRLLLAFERAETSNEVERRRQLLTFVLVGGGPTGVELAGAIAELAKASMSRDFRRIDPREARIVLIEAGAQLLPGYPERLGRYAAAALARMGVDVRVGRAVEDVRADGVFVGGEWIAAALVLWCAGVRAEAAHQWLKIGDGPGGRVPVEPDLSVANHPDIFVLGDASAARDASGQYLPGLASVAKQQGEHMASVIGARLAGNSRGPAFRYRDRGMLATIGRAAAVAQIGRFRLTGRIAWLLWGGVHLYYLVGFRNRLSVFIDWIWSWLTYSRGARLVTGTENAMTGVSDESSDGTKPAPGGATGRSAKTEFPEDTGVAP